MTEIAAVAPLRQPQPIIPQAARVVTEQLNEPVAFGESSFKSPRHSIGVLEPPTGLVEMDIAPEQLPLSAFVEAEPLPLTTSEPRPDTPPPPPPPSNMNEFVNYNTQTFGTARPHSEVPGRIALQWPPANNAAPVPAPANVPGMMNSNRPPSAAGTRNNLPVFSSSGAIPFAPRPDGVATVPKPEPRDEPKDIWEIPETPAR